VDLYGSKAADRKASSVTIISCRRLSGDMVYEARPQPDEAKIEGLNVKAYYSAVATAFPGFYQKFGAAAENVLGAGGITCFGLSKAPSLSGCLVSATTLGIRLP